MTQNDSYFDSDCVVVGASFAGLACATALAKAGQRVTVVDRKADPGEKLHTTGIIVKDAIDQISLLDELPGELVRPVPGVRLYSPNLRHIDLVAPGYYFLATDTPGVMRWLADQAIEAGVDLRLKTGFRHADALTSGFDLGDIGKTRFLVGADGPNSVVAKDYGLGRTTQFLYGIEHEYEGISIDNADKLHCFIDRKLAPGYIAWVVSGVTSIQVGVARRQRGEQVPVRDLMSRFLDKIAPIFDFRSKEPAGIRAGLIPCGGLVSPLAAQRVLLVGDAAGMVSPVTAGGIHTALRHGLAAGYAISDYLEGRQEDPSRWFVDTYPRFRTKRVLRFLFDHFQTDWAFNLLLGSPPMRAAASYVYFHRRGVFRPGATPERPGGRSTGASAEDSV